MSPSGDYLFLLTQFGDFLEALLPEKCWILDAEGQILASNQAKMSVDFQSKFRQMQKHKSPEFFERKTKNVFQFLIDGENSHLFSATQFDNQGKPAFLVKQVNTETTNTDFLQQLVGSQYGIYAWSFHLEKNLFVLSPDAAPWVLGKPKSKISYEDFFNALNLESLTRFSKSMEATINFGNLFQIELEFENSPQSKAEFSCLVVEKQSQDIVLRGLLKKIEPKVEVANPAENMELWINAGLKSFEVKDEAGETIAAFGRKQASRGVRFQDGKRISTVYDFRNQPRYQVLADIGLEEPPAKIETHHQKEEAIPEPKEEVLPLANLSQEEKCVSLTQWLGQSLDAEVSALGLFDGSRFEWKAWWKSPDRYAIPIKKYAGEWLPKLDWLVDEEISNQISKEKIWWNQEKLPFEISENHGGGWMLISESAGDRLTALLAIKTTDPQSVKEKTRHVLKGLGLLKKNERLPENNVQNLQEEIRQKDLLLKEVNHRAKNNLSLAASLVKMEAGLAEDKEARKILKSTQKRLETLASIHELMYKDPRAMEFVDMKSYLTPLVNGLVSSFANSDMQVELHVDSVLLDTKRANTIGLLVNELISNAFKHAFPEFSSGILKVDFLHKGDFFKLRVSDNGPGFLPDSIRNQSLGNLLIEEFVKQIDAKMEIDHANGTTYLIEFKK
jgi:two-component sensor histidine kinase